MSLPVMSFPILSFEQANPGLTAARSVNDILGTILQNQQQSIKNRYLGPSLEEQLAQSKLQTQIMGPEAKYAEPMTLAKLAAAQAEAPYKQALTQGSLAEAAYRRARIDPFASPEGMPELMKAEMYYKNMSDRFGPDHPATIEALHNYRIMQNTAQAATNWKEQLASSMGYRALPTAAKEALTVQQARAGFEPSALVNVPTGNVESPTYTGRATSMGDLPFGMVAAQQMQQSQMQGQPSLADIQQATNSAAAQQVAGQGTMTRNELADHMENALLKSTNTSQNLNKIQFGAQVEQTLANMMPFEPAMEYYTGAKGRARFYQDQLNAAAGNSSPEYQAYQAYMTHAMTAAKQMRQYWGDSIQPSVGKEIESLTDPAAWNRSPADVKAILNSVITNFNSELKQRRSAAQGPEIYRVESAPVRTLGQAALPTPKEAAQDIISGQTPTLGSVLNREETRTVRGKTYIKQNGKWYEK